jgi:hypothetical protein
MSGNRRIDQLKLGSYFVVVFISLALTLYGALHFLFSWAHGNAENLSAMGAAAPPFLQRCAPLNRKGAIAEMDDASNNRSASRNREYLITFGIFKSPSALVVRN